MAGRACCHPIAFIEEQRSRPTFLVMERGRLKDLAAFARFAMEEGRFAFRIDRSFPHPSCRYSAHGSLGFHRVVQIAKIVQAAARMMSIFDFVSFINS